MRIGEATQDEAVSEVVALGDVPVTVLRRGRGRPLLVLHDELGWAGWLGWTDALAGERELIVPLQPGFGVTPVVPWLRTFHDVAAFYGRLVRALGLPRVDVIGFSAGGFIAAEMAAAAPRSVDRLVLVAPLGVRPPEGEIADVMAMSIRDHLAATVGDLDAPDVRSIYGGEMTPEQFVLFEAARAETCRLGWAPYLFNPSLPHLLEGVGEMPASVIWGSDDRIVPRSCVETYARVMPNATLVEVSGVGHRPEAEAPERFVAAVRSALAREAT